MRQTLSKKDLRFIWIEPPYGAPFIENKQTELSDYQASMLKFIGDAIRTRYSQWFWEDSEYCWFLDSSHRSVERLWQTKNGILIYEQAEHLYRVQLL